MAYWFDKVVTSMKFARSSSYKAAPVYFWMGVAILVVVHSLRALGHTSPIYGGDEYAYLISGLHRNELEWLWSRDPMLQKVTNPLYLWAISTMHLMFTDVSAVMRLFNVFVFCATVVWGALWAAARGGWGSGIAALGLVGLLPSSAYTAAVMADVPFYCAVVLTALLACGAIADRPWAACLGAGAAAALAFLIKPHALSVIGCTWVFFLFAPLVLNAGSIKNERNLRGKLFEGLKLGGSFILALYAALLLSALFLYGKIIWDPRYPLGVFYSNIAGHMSSSGMTAALERPFELIRYVAANLVSAITVMWPFLVVLTLASKRVWKSHHEMEWGERTPVAVLWWLLLAIPLATGMSAFFTFSISNGQDGEAWRVHARYYAFLYVVAILGAMAVKDWASLLRAPQFRFFGVRVDGYLLVAITWPIMWVLSALVLKDMRVWFQDNVELFHLFISDRRAPLVHTQRLMLLAIIFATLTFVFKVKWIKGAFSVAIAVAFSAALWEVTRIQHIHSEVIHFRIESGQLVKSIVPDATDEQILVVGGSRYGQTAHVLYGMQRPVHVRQVDAGSVIDPTAVPREVRYVFSVDNVPLAMPSRVLFSTPAGTLHHLDTRAER